MKALWYDAPGSYRIDEVPTPAPHGTQVLVRVRGCGVCKTDLHIHAGHFLAAFPLIPGHEFAGEVAAVGEMVTRVMPGQRVVADNQRQCGYCDACRGGRPLFCENLYAQGVNAPGGFAEYVLVEERQLYPLADAVPDAVGALAEPVACAVHGMDVMRPRAGDQVLLFGAGPTGLILAQLLRAAGVSTLVVADLAPAKLALAAELAGAETVPVEREDPEAHVRAVQSRWPAGFDLVIDATGVPAVVERLPAFARLGGTLIFYGVCPEDAQIRVNPYEIFRRELTIRGSFSQVQTFERAVRLVNGGHVRLDPLVSHTLPLAGWPEALRLLADGRESLKIVLIP